MLSLSVIENYVLEIKARADAIRRNCNYLRTKNYSSKAPINLSITISRICDFLEKTVAVVHESATYSDPEERIKTVSLFKYIDLLIKDVGSHVEFIDGARSEKLPWSIIPSFHKLIKKLMNDEPEMQIMLLPQWNYNYSVDLTDMRKYYHEELKELQDFVPEMDLEKYVLENIKGAFYIISFPSVERKNILLHPLIGHEIGHLFAAKYIDNEKRTKFLEAVRPAIEEIVNKLTKDRVEDKELFKHAITTDRLKVACECWERGLEELLSDVVGAILFGPAILFSCFDLSVQQGLDSPPTESRKYYPPWRMRLRETLKVLDKFGEGFFPLTEDTIFDKNKSERVNFRYNEIKEIAERNDDLELIKQDDISRIAYEQISKDLDSGTQYFLDAYKLRNHLVTKSNLYRNYDLHRLIERLDNGIPPNAIENSSSDRRPADMVEIINAAWFYKISLADIGKDSAGIETRYKLKDRMNNLTLKAIEFAQVERDYMTSTGKLDHVDK